MSALPKTQFTVAEYFAIEGVSEVKHEYLDGQIYAMSGASPDHDRIVGDTQANLIIASREGQCEVFTSDMRAVVNHAIYFYPDLKVTCETPRFTTMQGLQSLTNPTLIIEVLSPSTEKFDRGEKFQRYQTLDSLQEYVLITQNAPLIEIYNRHNHRQWLYTAVHGLDATVTLESIGCTLALADVYRRVAFDPPASETPQED